jgi:ABC-2 type transport system ATP-binding protein
MQQEVLHLVREARQNGATVFFSSHILSEVEAISDRVGIIRQGVMSDVAETSSLINRSVRRVRIRFKQPVDTALLEDLTGIQVLSKDSDQDLLLQVEGEMDGLIKTLAEFPVLTWIQSTHLWKKSFLVYYEKDAP